MSPRSLFLTLVVTLSFLTSVTSADKLFSFRINDGRLLTLIRKPAVLDELKLSKEQLKQIRELNDQVDGPLVRSRNWKSDAFVRQLNQLTRSTEARLAKILNRQQYNRLSQINFFAVGYRALQLEQFSSRLKLTDEQIQQIRDLSNENNKHLKFRPQNKEFGGNADVLKVLEAEDKQVLKLLSQTQRHALEKMAGAVFDRTKLTGARFKAPEFIGDTWLKSDKPIKVSDSRGKVLVIHFWAFG